VSIAEDYDDDEDCNENGDVPRQPLPRTSIRMYSCTARSTPLTRYRHCIDVLGPKLFNRVHDFFTQRLLRDLDVSMSDMHEGEELRSLVTTEQLPACHLVKELVSMETGSHSRD